MAIPMGFEQRVFVLTTIASATLAPTAAEMSAGVEITGDLPAPINFAGSQRFAETSDISTAQDKQQTSTISIENLEIEIWKRTAGGVAYDALDNDTEYFIVKFEGGGIAGADPAAADTADVAKVKIGLKSDGSTPRGEARRKRVPMGLLEAIAWDVAVLA